MRLSKLTDCLINYVSFLKSFKDETININAFKILKRGETKFVDGCLYIGLISNLPIIPPKTQFTIICIEDTPLPKIYEEVSECNICVIKSKINQYEILALISEIMNDEMELIFKKQKLLNTVYSNNGLQSLIDTARDILGHPILVLDNSFKIMALSYDVISLKRFSKDTMVSHYLDANTIEFIRNNNILSKTRNSGASHYVKKKDPLDGTLVTLIHIEGIEVGELVIFEIKKKFQSIDFELATSLSKLLSIELQKTNFFNINKDFMTNYILTDLIEKNFIREDIISKRFYHLDLIKSKALYIVVITNKYLKSFDSKIPFIIQSLKSFIPMNSSIVYKSSLVIFIDETVTNNLFINNNLEFSEYLKTNSLYASISLKFNTLSSSRKYYLQALKANEIGQLYNIHICNYFKCTKYIIADLISTKYDWQDFCHPAVIALEKKDNKDGTNFLETLKYYIYFTNSPNHAAKVLCIHRNTLFYRINKIKELCNITLNNADEIFHIYYSIKLIEFNTKKYNFINH